MQFKQKSVVALSIILMAGCSANRQARQADDSYDSSQSLPGRMRHADEYESGDRQYEYEYDTAPSRSKMNDPTQSPSPPAMRPPVPAPPAIGVSRVKSVSWLRYFDIKSNRSSCGDNSGQSGCATGSVSPLTSDYFAEGCTTPPRTAVVPPKQCREKTTLVEVVRGWNLRPERRGTDRIFPPRTCGEKVAQSPGCYAPPGCSANHASGKPSVLNSDTHRSADDDKDYSLAEDDLDAPETNHGSGFSPDELMELPADLEQMQDKQKPRVPAVPESPAIHEAPVLPLPAPAVLSPATSVPAPQQFNPDSVRNNTRPPMWPRLGQPMAKPVTLPVTTPWLPNDSPLPVIQPGRRI